jgi:hypothetical protein
VQLGAERLTGYKWGIVSKKKVDLTLKKRFWRRKSCVNPVYFFCLSFNMTCGAYLIHQVHLKCTIPPLHFLHCHWTPLGQKTLSFPAATTPHLLARVLNRKQLENGKISNRQRNFTNYIPLESSNQGEFREVISFENDALCITRMQREENWVWRWIGRLREGWGELVVQEAQKWIRLVTLLHEFDNRIGAQKWNQY